jgi:hypothetical protein
MMKRFKNLQMYFFFNVITLGFLLLSIVSQDANADTSFFQCQLKNDQMTFSDKPCSSTQKFVPNKKAKKTLDTQLAPTISIAEVRETSINNTKDCANLNRLGIKRKYEIRSREAHSKYWRSDQADELKEVLSHLNKMQEKEFEGC